MTRPASNRQRVGAHQPRAAVHDVGSPQRAQVSAALDETAQVAVG